MRPGQADMTPGTALCQRVAERPAALQGCRLDTGHPTSDSGHGCSTNESADEVQSATSQRPAGAMESPVCSVYCSCVRGVYGFSHCRGAVERYVGLSEMVGRARCCLSLCSRDYGHSDERARWALHT